MEAAQKTTPQSSLQLQEDPASDPAQVRLVLPHYQSINALKSYLPELLKTLQEAHGLSVEVVLVDDGSSHLLQKLLIKWVVRLQADFPQLTRCIVLEDNYGKGYAIRQGWRDAADATQILAFVDADGSIPAESVAQQLQLALQTPDKLRCAIRPAFSKQTRSIKRQLMGKLFSCYVRSHLNLQITDPQCGFKMVPSAVYRRLERRLKIDRFSFDCELLAHAQQIGVEIIEDEVPWIESSTSTIRAIRDGWHMLRDIHKLKKRLQIRRYKRF